jgi:hypothetical protein
LQKYLESKSQKDYDTASFGETTSADELQVQAQQSIDNDLQIFRQSNLTKTINQAR